MRELVGVDILLLDEKLLTEGATYEIRRFDVISSNAEFQVLRFKHFGGMQIKLGRKSLFSIMFGVPLYVDEDIMATLHDRCVSKELKNQWLLPKMISQTIQRSKIQEQVRSDRTKVFVEKYQSCDSEHRGLPRIEYLKDIRRTPSVLKELYLMRAIFFAKYIKKIPCREANKDPIFFATLKQQLIIWENITHQDKVQPGSATDGSSQANDIDGKKKAKRAEVPTNTCQFPPIKSMDVSQH
ncbi:hypothetical protein F2Q70_00035993 [Brassica cretica]|uniref:Uncharacterized protein n=1 Tax=Brassica cretica TaxID=69181 RepID=A0A8S9JSX1_BRACR|nr:hypothetical protein F2Q70_00035993 [Brassica cretica]